MDYYLGEITIFGFSWPPRGFALCNGAIVPIQQNTALFSLLGTTFGGNGQSTFGLPNLGGRMAIGQGQSPGTSNYLIGEIAGAEGVALTQKELPAHIHGAVTNVNATTAITALGAPTARLPSPANNYLTSVATTDTPPKVITGYAASGAGTPAAMAAGMATTTATATTTVQPAGNSLPFSILQPLLALNYVIVTQGVFPSRT
ncbi:MAG: tail fiber protein [Opitutaceae bacterium]|nr:tail fiber protein [Opitutaceae bacterium]